MVRVIEAARAGKTILDFPVYDGSDSGDKVYNTLTVIGHKLTPDEHKHDDAAGAEPTAGVPVQEEEAHGARANQAGDVVFGSIISGRPPAVPGIERMVGLLINALPVRVTFEPSDSLAAIAGLSAAVWSGILTYGVHVLVNVLGLKAAVRKSQPSAFPPLEQVPELAMEV